MAEPCCRTDEWPGHPARARRPDAARPAQSTAPERVQPNACCAGPSFDQAYLESASRHDSIASPVANRDTTRSRSSGTFSVFAAAALCYVGPMLRHGDLSEERQPSRQGRLAERAFAGQASAPAVRSAAARTPSRRAGRVTMARMSRERRHHASVVRLSADYRSICERVGVNASFAVAVCLAWCMNRCARRRCYRGGLRLVFVRGASATGLCSPGVGVASSRVVSATDLWGGRTECA